ncbi:hypothetical protein N7453_010085 [Penicillium expansum]|nr:hypothetical protein N7453_010085 [Penicillium expansum]
MVTIYHLSIVCTSLYLVLVGICLVDLLLLNQRKILLKHTTVSWSSGYDFPLTSVMSVCSGKVLGSIPRETIFCIFGM